MPTDTAVEEQICLQLPDLPADKLSELASVIRHLVDSFHPEQIYVFGSLARGQATPDSDIDLLVLVAHSDLPAHRRDQLAYQAVGPHCIPLDILVMTIEEFDRRRGAVSSLPATVLREGRVLYAA